MLEDPAIIGDPVSDTDQAVILNDERVGTSQGFTIGEPMPSGEPPVYYWLYTSGDVPPGTLFMTETIAIASGYTLATTVSPASVTSA